MPTVEFKQISIIFATQGALRLAAATLLRQVQWIHSVGGHVHC